MHSLLGADVRFLDVARYGARLVDLGDFPGVVAPTSAVDVVIGELFLVDAAVSAEVLARLDRYEGEAFERREVPVTTEGGQELLAWVYHYRGDPARGRLVSSGDWLEDPSRRVNRAGRGVRPG